jgi:ubiquinone/menaquinone biosynthesis C-methylase UbiE
MNISNHYIDTLVARSYKYRPPYHPKFIDNLAAKVCLNKSDSALDLLCGQGEISTKLSSHCKYVIGVDGSRRMLDLATTADNIKYLIGDVNHPDFINIFNGETFSHCFIGRAIHWISEDSLTEIRKRLLDKSAWLVTMQGGYDRNNPWLKSYNAVIENFASKGSRSDLISREKILNSGFSYHEPIGANFNLKLSINFLYGSALSYRPAVTHILKMHETEVKSELKNALSKFLVDGFLVANISNSGFIYKSS